MIRSFRERDPERVFDRIRVPLFSSRLQRRAHRKLLILDAAESLEDLKVPPGNRLEELIGNRAGAHSIRIDQQWRICFRWKEGDAFDVEIVDYH